MKNPRRRRIVSILAAVLLLALLTMIFIRKANRTDGIYSSYMLSYVMSGSWEPGVNLFAIARIMLMVGSVAVLIIGVDLIATYLCRVLERRAQTICRLLCSIVKYGFTLYMLFGTFTLLGFDTNALLASVGLFSLTVSLGAKDLVADVLSGISITFADEYQIGDFIEVNNFQGWVLDIGVRTTMLVNNSGNIKNMSNRDVKNVMNLSRRNCRYTINITITYDQSLQKVEEILNTELPKIGEDIREIISGPTYQGVTGIGNGGLTLSIIAECKEHNYGHVRSRVKREIRLMLEKNGITIK